MARWRLKRSRRGRSTVQDPTLPSCAAELSADQGLQSVPAAQQARSDLVERRRISTAVLAPQGWQRSLALRQLGVNGLDGSDELVAVGRWHELDRPARGSKRLPRLGKDRSGVTTGPIRADGDLVQQGSFPKTGPSMSILRPNVVVSSPL
jgi:hypothetical protein